MAKKNIFILLIFSLIPLFSKGQNQDEKVWEYSISMIEAVFAQQPDSVLYYLKKGAKVNFRDANGMTALYYAIQNNDLDMVKILLHNGADINFRNYNDYQTTPLIDAVVFGDFDIAEYLCQQGAKVDLTDLHRATALHYAAGLGDFYMTGLLLWYGADANKVTAVGDLPLHLAALNNDTSVVSLLWPVTDSINKTNEAGYSPMDIAVVHGNNRTVNYLFKKNPALLSHPAAVEKYINEALDNHHDSLALSLIKYDRHQPAKNSDSPFCHACHNHSKKVMSLLKDRGLALSGRPCFTGAFVEAGMKRNSDNRFYFFRFGTGDCRYNIRFYTGFDMRFKRQKVLLKLSDNQYLQLDEKRVAWSTGLVKYFEIWHTSPLVFELLAGAEFNLFMGNYQGTSHRLEPRYNFSPKAGVAICFNDWQWEAFYQYYPLGRAVSSPDFFGLGLSWQFSLLKRRMTYQPDWL